MYASVVRLYGQELSIDPVDQIELGDALTTECFLPTSRGAEIGFPKIRWQAQVISDVTQRLGFELSDNLPVILNPSFDCFKSKFS